MTCVIDGCKRTVPPPFCLCNGCYKLLPAPLRTELSRAYNPHAELDAQAPGFVTALAKVHSWIRETLGGAADKRPRESWETVVAAVRARDAARGQKAPVLRVFDDSESEDSQPAPPAQTELF